MQVLDYSAGFPGAAAIKAAGYLGAVRYIGSPGNIKCATADELRDFTEHGLGMALVFEQTAGQWRNGYGQGQQDALNARHHASAIGFPLDRPIYFAIDQDVVTEAEFRQMDSYADGWASILGHDLCGPYGEHDVVARCYERGFKWIWQCRAWSGTPVRYFGLRHLFQNVGTVMVGPEGRQIPCDTNEVSQDDWGQTGGGMSVQDVIDGLKAWVRDKDAMGELRGQTVSHLEPVKPERLDENGKPVTSSVQAEAQWNAHNFAEVFSRLDSIEEAVSALQTGTGYSLAELVEAINNDADARRRDGDASTGPVT